MPTTTTALALKEWGAVVHALLHGRQTVLLRKGGIRERRFDIASDRFVLFPTVAHAHVERVRAGHDDLLAAGAGDVDDGGTFVVRAGVTLVDVIGVDDAAALGALHDLHIWTPEHIAERMAFRPKRPLQVLVVNAVALAEPAIVARTADHGGCTSWVDLPVAWDGLGTAVHSAERLAEVAARVRAAVR